MQPGNNKARAALAQFIQEHPEATEADAREYMQKLCGKDDEIMKGGLWNSVEKDVNEEYDEAARTNRRISALEKS